MEVWKDISGYEGYYQISNFGQIRSVPRYITHKTKGGGFVNQYFKGKILKPTTTRNGYKMIVLSKDGKFKYQTIHRLVATAFIPNPENKPTVNHKDGDKSNNHVDNLEWCTSSENNSHAYRIGLKKGRGKTKVYENE